ncbi:MULTISPECIES: ABC transporter permease [unclassified Leucobacter]|uniref:ABC transporter permease n=1 Tax=unclassified Leucobacter TaxID=2621730 RepID=UPI00165DC5D1|nr:MULTISPECIES: ABC transporter permease [unclassified Leucobacter]MBC9926025.1 ABC transporter permease [Leucobacter sp. cx-169]MBC9935678.1 ABC transporter permease [Leucobacter sp. cx-87]
MAFTAFASGKVVEQAPRKGTWVALLLLLPGIAYMVLFFVTPFIQLFLTSLQAPAASGGIGDYVAATQFSNYWAALAEYWPQLVRSFTYALIATVVALVIAYPLAYMIGVKARSKPMLQGILLILVVAPFFISFLLRTLAWKQILPGEWIGTDFSVIFGLVYNFIPFMTLPIFASLQQLDLRLVEAGSDLYASPVTTFRKVTLPLSMTGIVSGTLLTFIPMSGDYVNASREFLGSTNTPMIGNVIEANFLQTQNYPMAASLSILLMIIILIIVATYVRKSGTEDLL